MVRAGVELGFEAVLFRASHVRVFLKERLLEAVDLVGYGSGKAVVEKSDGLAGRIVYILVGAEIAVLGTVLGREKLSLVDVEVRADGEDREADDQNAYESRGNDLAAAEGLYQSGDEED